MKPFETACGQYKYSHVFDKLFSYVKQSLLVVKYRTLLSTANETLWKTIMDE